MLFRRRLCIGLALTLLGILAPRATAFADSNQPIYDSSAGVYEVFTAAQLEYLDNPSNLEYSTYLSGHIQLMADISLSGFSWTPIGVNSDFPFTGTFDGNHHVIDGLTINADNQSSSIGFFGASRGQIENLGLTNVNVTGGSNEVLGTGALVGDLSGGSVSDSYSTGNVTGHTEIGGLVGLNAGTVQNSFSSANVTGLVEGESTGGLVGLNDGIVKNSYATGKVSGPTYNGGLVGQNSSYGSVTKSYSVSSVGAGQAAGALIGSSQGTVTASVYDAGSNTGLPGVSVGLTDGIIGLTDTSTKDPADSAYQTWDFAKTWVANHAVNNGYPALQDLLNANFSAVPTTLNAAQTMTVYSAVYYASAPVAGYPITLTATDGKWQNGNSVAATVSNPGSAVDTWTPPNVISTHVSTVSASVYDVPALSPISVTVNPFVPTMPTGLVHTDVSQTGWTESWNPVDGASNYKVSLSGKAAQTVTQATYTFTGATPATNYTVTITPVTAVGVSGPSAEDSISTLANQPAPPPPPPPPPPNQPPTPPVITQPPSPPVILTDSISAVAQVGNEFVYQFLESGGASPLKWSVSSGQLPGGSALSDTGQISGTVTATPGIYQFTVQVKDANSLSATREYSLRVVMPPKPVFIPDKYGVFAGIRGPIQYGPNAFDIESFQMSTSQASNPRSAGGARERSGHGVLTQIVVQRVVDSASPQLYDFALIGKSFHGELVIQRKVKGMLDVLHDVTFVGTIISDSMSFDSPGGMQEQLTIQATNVKDIHRVDKVKGSAQG